MDQNVNGIENSTPANTKRIVVVLSSSDSDSDCSSNDDAKKKKDIVTQLKVKPKSPIVIDSQPQGEMKEYSTVKKGELMTKRSRGRPKTGQKKVLYALHTGKPGRPRILQKNVSVQVPKKTRKYTSRTKRKWNLPPKVLPKRRAKISNKTTQRSTRIVKRSSNFVESPASTSNQQQLTVLTNAGSALVDIAVQTDDINNDCNPDGLSPSMNNNTQDSFEDQEYTQPVLKFHSESVISVSDIEHFVPNIDILISGVVQPTVCDTTPTATPHTSTSFGESFPSKNEEENSQKVGPQQIVKGIVSKIHGPFGMINEEILFHISAVMGPSLKEGDNVIVKHEAAVGMPFQFCATMVSKNFCEEKKEPGTDVHTEQFPTKPEAETLSIQKKPFVLKSILKNRIVPPPPSVLSKPEGPIVEEYESSFGLNLNRKLSLPLNEMHPAKRRLKLFQEDFQEVGPAYKKKLEESTYTSNQQFRKRAKSTERSPQAKRRAWSIEGASQMSRTPPNTRISAPESSESSDERSRFNQTGGCSSSATAPNLIASDSSSSFVLKTGNYSNTDSFTFTTSEVPQHQQQPPYSFKLKTPSSTVPQQSRNEYQLTATHPIFASGNSSSSEDESANSRRPSSNLSPTISEHVVNIALVDNSIYANTILNNDLPAKSIQNPMTSRTSKDSEKNYNSSPDTCSSTSTTPSFQVDWLYRQSHDLFGFIPTGLQAQCPYGTSPVGLPSRNNPIINVPGNNNVLPTGRIVRDLEALPVSPDSSTTPQNPAIGYETTANFCWDLQKY